MRRRLLAVVLVAGATACQRPTEVVVFHAASLRRVFADAALVYEKEHPKVRLRLEPSGSQVAIRKVTEQSLRADVVAVADASLIDTMMFPQHARWNLEFATNELVLAHLQHSRFTDEVTEKNWPQVLLRAGVRLGRVNPDTAPLGYHTLFAWQLAERAGLATSVDERERFAGRLADSVAPEHFAADESELLALLEGRAIDYAFLYRSTAEDHRLKVVALPAEVNLGRSELAEGYGYAEVELHMKRAEGTRRVHHLRGHHSCRRASPGRGRAVPRLLGRRPGRAAATDGRLPADPPPGGPPGRTAHPGAARADGARRREQRSMSQPRRGTGRVLH